MVMHRTYIPYSRLEGYVGSIPTRGTKYEEKDVFKKTQT